MAKSKPRSMRFDMDVEAYINGQKGEDFSDKFHALVRKFKDLEGEKERRIAMLDKEIADKEKRIRDLNQFLFDVHGIENQFRSLQQSINSCKGYMEHFLKKDMEKLSVVRK